MKRARHASSGQSVNTSSSWSTITSDGGGPAASERSSSATGSAPGVITTTRPSRARRYAGTSPARTSDDFPLPDAPTTAMKPPSRSAFENGGHDLLPPEEEVVVLGPEGHQPAIGTRLPARAGIDRPGATSAHAIVPVGDDASATSARPISGGNRPLIVSAVASSITTWRGAAIFSSLTASAADAPL